MDLYTYLIVDFDSTFISTETLEEIAEIALKNNPHKNDIYNTIQTITKMGMSGQITFQESLRRRLELINITNQHLVDTTAVLANKITPSFQKNKRFFAKYKQQIFIISGGFQECLDPILVPFGLEKDHIFGNNFIHDKNSQITGIDLNNPLSKKNGKYRVAKSLPIHGYKIVIGDGITDYQIKELGAADYFIAFTENVSRQAVVNKADCVAANFDEVLRYI